MLHLSLKSKCKYLLCFQEKTLSPCLANYELGGLGIGAYMPSLGTGLRESGV